MCLELCSQSKSDLRRALVLEREGYFLPLVERLEQLVLPLGNDMIGLAVVEELGPDRSGERGQAVVQRALHLQGESCPAVLGVEQDLLAADGRDDFDDIEHRHVPETQRQRFVGTRDGDDEQEQQEPSHRRPP